MIDPSSVHGKGVALLRDTFNDRIPDDTEASWRAGRLFRTAWFMEAIITNEEDIANRIARGEKITRAKPGMMSFCGLDVRMDDPTVPRDEVHLVKDGEVIGKITGIAVPGMD